MLTIAVRFLSGQYYAASHSDRTRPEWPPHPDRLFSALVATCYQSCAGSGRTALEWLEQQGAPSLAASPIPLGIKDGRTLHAMVRTNDPGSERIKALPDRRKPQLRWFPSIAVDAPVYFIWPNANPEPETATTLAQVISQLAYLGSSKSAIIAWIEERPPTPTLVPGVDSGASEEPIVLRVPTPGRLADLDAHYAAGLRPRPGHQQQYHWVAADTNALQHSPHPSAFGDMVIFARTAGTAPTPEATLTVTHALRRALLALGDDRTEDELGIGMPELLHGHGAPGSPHCAFVMLPHVGAAYADGHLLGVAIIFPRSCEADQRSAVLRILNDLRHVQTPAGRIDIAPVAQRPPDALPWGLQSERWRGPPSGARIWTSVTPVLFDRFPRSSRGGVLGAVQTLTQHVGLPVPNKAVTHQLSPLTGVPPATAYRTKRAREDPQRYVSHLTITFDQPAMGPIILGAGRFFGLGLFTPLHGDEG